MGVVAVYSIKGGVGKTTISFDLAWRAARRGQRTLLWDLDLQGGAGFLLDEALPHIPRAVSAFRPGGLLRQLVRPTRFENLFHLPADESLRVLPNELARMRERNRLTGLTRLLSGEFRWIVLDCPPAMNEVSDQIIAAADLIVVPLPPSPLAMRALETVRTELAHNHSSAPPLFPVLSMVDLRRKVHRQAVLDAKLDWPVVPLASDIERMAQERSPIDQFAPNGKGAKALARLHERIDQHMSDLPERMNQAPIRQTSHMPGQSTALTVLPRSRLSALSTRGGRLNTFLRWLLRV